MSANDRVLLLAGSRGALGAAVLDQFLAAGYVVGALHRGVPPTSRPGVLPFEAELSDAASVTRAVDACLSKTGRIDILINAAGGFAGGRVVETTDALWNAQISANVSIPFVLSRAVLPHMTARGTGRIWHVGARAALHPFPGAAAYIVSKTALLGLVRVLALELAGTGVTVNALLPGILDTPANRREMPAADTSGWVPTADVARIMLALCAPDAKHVNGETITVG